MGEMQVVSVVGAKTEMGRYIRHRTPCWAGLLGEQVEVNPETAEFTDTEQTKLAKDKARVRVWAKALTGPQTGVTFTPITSMLVITDAQKELFWNHAKAKPAPKPKMKTPAPKSAAPPV